MMLIINKSLFVLFFYILCLSFSPFLRSCEEAFSVEEGWRWKSEFRLKFRDKREQAVDGVHEELSGHEFRIREILSRRKPEPSNEREVLKSIHWALNKSDEAWDIFKKLRHDKISIERIINSLLPDRKLATEKYWKYESNGQDRGERFEEINRIVEENIVSFISQRNFVVASLGYMRLNKYETIDINDNGKICIFVSGTGNEFAELLNYIDDFGGYKFITFDQHYKDFLAKNLGFIFTHTTKPFPNSENIRRKSKDYGGEIDKYVSEYKQFLINWKAYHSIFASVKEKFSEILLFEESDPSPSLASLSEKAIDQHRSFIESTIQLFPLINKLRASYESSKNFIPLYCHSEQLFRLFFYRKIRDFLTDDILNTLEENLIVLHLHSTNDICERCTHCLFLESEMCYAEESQRPLVKKTPTRSERDPFGFFEKLNRYTESQLQRRFNYLILASSKTVGQKRGIAHRYLLGRDKYEAEPIEIERFSPLIAFKFLLEKPIKPLSHYLMQYEEAHTELLIAASPSTPLLTKKRGRRYYEYPLSGEGNDCALFGFGFKNRFLAREFILSKSGDPDIRQLVVPEIRADIFELQSKTPGKSFVQCIRELLNLSFSADEEEDVVLKSEKVFQVFVSKALTSNKMLSYIVNGTSLMDAFAYALGYNLVIKGLNHSGFLATLHQSIWNASQPTLTFLHTNYKNKGSEQQILGGTPGTAVSNTWNHFNLLSPSIILLRSPAVRVGQEFLSSRHQSFEEWVYVKKPSKKNELIVKAKKEKKKN